MVESVFFYGIVDIYYILLGGALMSVYPDWINQFRKKGTCVKKVGNQYYLYSHTSKRVPGKKWPQSVDKFLGVITKEGVIYSSKRNVSLSDIEVFEYGFSYTLLSLCPQRWKSDKKDWKDILYKLIMNESTCSYLQMESWNKDVHCSNLSFQKKKLETELKFELTELEALKGIYLICFKDGREVISKIHDDQQKILDKHGIVLSSDKG